MRDGKKGYGAHAFGLPNFQSLIDNREKVIKWIKEYLTGLRKGEIASLTPESFQLDDQTPTLTLEARNSNHRKRDVLPLHPQLVALLRQWLPEYSPGESLFPKLAKRKAYMMIRKDLEAAGIPYSTKDGDADFHAAGRHTYITGLLRNGTSLVVARELARHSDVKMTMRYTHIGLKDQAKGIQKLPTDPKWLGSRRPTESASQHFPVRRSIFAANRASPRGSPSRQKTLIVTHKVKRVSLGA